MQWNKVDACLVQSHESQTRCYTSNLYHATGTSVNNSCLNFRVVQSVSVVIRGDRYESHLAQHFWMGER